MIKQVVYIVTTGLYMVSEFCTTIGWTLLLNYTQICQVWGQQMFAVLAVAVLGSICSRVRTLCSAVPFAACGSAPESYTSAQCSSQDPASLSISVPPSRFSTGSNPSDHFSILIPIVLHFILHSPFTDMRQNAALEGLDIFLRIRNVPQYSLPSTLCKVNFWKCP
jgi:hypothetical protein